MATYDTFQALRAALAKRAMKMQTGGAERIGGDDGGRIASGVYVAPANRKRAEDGDGPAGDGPAKGTYVPPSMRPGRAGAAGPGGGSSMHGERDVSCTVRVTNISENTREEDLRDLFRGFGAISRCYLALDKVKTKTPFATLHTTVHSPVSVPP